MGTKNLSYKQLQALTELIRDVHAAALKTTAWPEVLGCLRAELDAEFVVLLKRDFSVGETVALHESPSEMKLGEAMQHFSTRSPWYLSSVDYAAGRVMSGDDLVAISDLKRTDYYRCFLQPRGLLHRLCGVAAHRESAAFLVEAYRGENRPPFGDEEKTFLAMLLEHIALSLECQWRRQEADDLADMLRTVADREIKPIILVTASAESIYRNRAAEKMLDASIGIRMQNQRVIATNPEDQPVLRQAIIQMTDDQTAETIPFTSSRTITLRPDRSGQSGVVIVRPAGSLFMREAGRRRSLAQITLRSGNDAAHDPTTCSFARQYNLTAAQARVSTLVFSGQTISGVARSLNISENTVRTHLKQIFQKTGAHRQAELIRLHTRLCVPLI